MRTRDGQWHKTRAKQHWKKRSTNEARINKPNTSNKSNHLHLRLHHRSDEVVHAAVDALGSLDEGAHVERPMLSLLRRREGVEHNLGTSG